MANMFIENKIAKLMIEEDLELKNRLDFIEF